MATAFVLITAACTGGTSQPSPSGPSPSARTTVPQSVPAEVSDPSIPASVAAHYAAIDADRFYVRSCDERVMGDLGDGWRRRSTIVGPVAFVNLPGYADTPPEERDGGGYHPTKLLVVLEPGSTATLVVPDAEAEHVGLVYDPALFNVLSTAEEADRAVVFEACDGLRTQFNGAVLVEGARCVGLDLWLPEETSPRRLVASFGAGGC